ncbi:MAG: GntR family transcriptional regulator [Candidatus Pacebacteria bacterium]|nr:GntR family transcriptional regulator [Candidatus Paceibacterota bacterium]
MDIATDKQVLKPVTVKRASEEIYDQIRQKITDGELRPGDRLPSEKYVMEMMHRSRATIREALRMLEGDGYIKTIPGSAGAVVQKLDTRSMEQSFDALLRLERISIRELGELRDVIEVQTAGWAAERRMPEDLEALRAYLRLEKKYAGNTRAFFMIGGDRSENGFHILLAKAAHNDFAQMIERVIGANVRNYVLEEMARVSIEDQEKLCRAIFEKHSRVVEAIADQDRERAMDEMRYRTVPFTSDSYIEDYTNK